jgi:hypothetical protein
MTYETATSYYDREWEPKTLPFSVWYDVEISCIFMLLKKWTVILECKMKDEFTIAHPHLYLVVSFHGFL